MTSEQILNMSLEELCREMVEIMEHNEIARKNFEKMCPNLIDKDSMMTYYRVFVSAYSNK